MRVNLTTQKIQVIDNGFGISKKNLKLIGHRHATSKYYSSTELQNNFKIGPNRGEALASIINLSKNVKITSRIMDTKKSYYKIFEEGKSLSVNLAKERPSKGTTVEIQMFLYNRPVRKKCLNNTLLLEEIKQELEHFALIHPKVSVSLRNDSTGETIFHTYRTKFVFQTVSHLFGKDFTKKFRKLSYSKEKMSLNGIISIKPQVQNKFQLVYINYRHIKKCKIHTTIISLISKSKILNKNFAETREKHSAFIINIKCSYSEIDILEYFDLKIEFKDLDKIISFVEEGVTLFLQKGDLLEVKERPKKGFLKGSPISQKIPSIHISQFCGVIKGIPMKRKCISEKIMEEKKDSQKSDSSCVDIKKTKFLSLTKNKTEELFSKSVEERKMILPKELLVWSSSTSNNFNCKKIEENQILVSQPKQQEQTQIKQNVLKSLNGKQLIMDMFLKSTAIFNVDEDLVYELEVKRNLEIGEKQNSSILSNKATINTLTNKMAASNNLNNTSPLPNIEKQTLVKEQQFKLNFRPSVFNNNCNDEIIFKKPLPIQEKKPSYRINKKNGNKIDLNRKSDPKSIYKSHRNNYKISQNILSKFHYERKPFHKLFIGELCTQVSRNNPHHNFVKNSRCSIKHLRFEKKLNCVRSSDFLKPALGAVKKITEKNENRNIIPKKFMHSSDMLETWFDTKYNQHNRKTFNQNLPIFLESRKHNFIENQTSILTPVQVNKKTKLNFNVNFDKPKNLPRCSRELLQEKPVSVFNIKTKLQKRFQNMNSYRETYDNTYYNKYDFKNSIDKQISILTPVEISKKSKLNFNFSFNKQNNLPQFSKELIQEKPVPIFNIKTNLRKHFQNMDSYREPDHYRYYKKFDLKNNVDNEKNKYSVKSPSFSQFFAKTQITYDSHKNAAEKQIQNLNVYTTNSKKPFLRSSKNILPNTFKINSGTYRYKNTNIGGRLNIIRFCQKAIKVNHNEDGFPNINNTNQIIDEKITNINQNNQSVLQNSYKFLKSKNTDNKHELNTTSISKENKNTLANQKPDQTLSNSNSHLTIDDISVLNSSQQLSNKTIETTENNHKCSISKISSLERLLKTQNIDITPFCSKNIKLNLIEGANNLGKGNFDLFKNTTRQENIESTSNKSVVLNISNSNVCQKITNNESISQIDIYSKSHESVFDGQKESQTQNTNKEYTFTESEEDTEYLRKKNMQVKYENILSERKQIHIQKWVENQQIYLASKQHNQISSKTDNINETKSENVLKKSSNSSNERRQYLNEWFENNAKYFSLNKSIEIISNNSRTPKTYTTSEANFNNKNKVEDNYSYKDNLPSQSLFSKSVSNKMDLSLAEEEKNSQKREINSHKTETKKPEKSQDIIYSIADTMLDKLEDNNKEESLYSFSLNHEKLEECEVDETRYTNVLNYNLLKLNNEQTSLPNLTCMEDTNNNLNNQTIEEIEISVNPQDILNSNESSDSYLKNFNPSEMRLKCIEERKTNENLNNQTSENIEITIDQDYILNANESSDSYFKDINSSELVREFEEIDKKNFSPELLETTKRNTRENTHQFEFNFKDSFKSSSNSNVSTINKIISQEFNSINCNNNEQPIFNPTFNFNPSFLSNLNNMPKSPLYGIKASEWMQQKTESGNSYYLNTRTGMTSFLSPKEVEGCCMTKRFSFMPKGMSPILLNTSTLLESKELSPNSKNLLHQTLANSEDKLKTVKWMNYLQNSGKFCYTSFYKKLLKINYFQIQKNISMTSIRKRNILK